MIHSFLLIGQSNMAGRGRFDEVAPIENENIFVLRNGIFRPMHLPVNFDRFFSGVCLAESFADAYQKETGVETKFARLAHVVRGGNPTLKDRVLGTTMGAIAVEELLKGNSNLVICERHGDIVATDIAYALTADKINKNLEVTEEELACFTEEERRGMMALVDERRADIAELYAVAEKINL